MSSVVDKADPTDPRFNQAFVEYAQDRGFLIDPARVRTPTDKPRVERIVPFVRNSFFAGEEFVDLADAQRRAEEWCAGPAGHADPRDDPVPPGRAVRPERSHCCSPRRCSPTSCRTTPKPKVHRDHHIEVAGPSTPCPAT